MYGHILMKTLSIEACFLSLKGLDIIDIPGTVGGGIIMKASFRETGLFDPLIKVKAISPEGKVFDLINEECKLAHSGRMLKAKKYIVIEALFKLQKGDQMEIQKKMTNNYKKDMKHNQCILEVLVISLYGIIVSMELCMKIIKNLISLVIKLEI